MFWDTLKGVVLLGLAYLDWRLKNSIRKFFQVPHCFERELQKCQCFNSDFISSENTDSTIDLLAWAILREGMKTHLDWFNFGLQKQVPYLYT